MQIAIISDIHDHAENLKLALAEAREADVLICCGDLCSPFVVAELGRGFSKPVHIVFGNNDGDPFRLAGVAAEFSQIQVHAEYVELELGGVSFSINHYDNIGRAIARGEVFDVVCYGHNHTFEITPHGSTLAINPGEIYGKRKGHATFAMYDTATRQARRIDLKPA